MPQSGSKGWKGWYKSLVSPNTAIGYIVLSLIVAFLIKYLVEDVPAKETGIPEREKKTVPQTDQKDSGKQKPVYPWTDPASDSFIQATQKPRRQQTAGIVVSRQQQMPVNIPAGNTSSTNVKTGKPVISYDFVIAVLNDQQPDGPLAMKVATWLERNNSGSQVTTRSVLLSRTNFERLKLANSDDIPQLLPGINPLHLCLVESDIDYRTNAISADLTTATALFKIVIIRTGDGKIIYNEEKSLSGAGLDRVAALVMVKERFTEFLQQTPLSL